MLKSSGGSMLSEQISLTRLASASSCSGSSDCGRRSSITPRTRRPPRGVGERRKLVGEIVATRSGDLRTLESSLLQLEAAVLAEANLFPETWSVDWHGAYLSGSTDLMDGYLSRRRRDTGTGITAETSPSWPVAGRASLRALQWLSPNRPMAPPWRASLAPGGADSTTQPSRRCCLEALSVTSTSTLARGLIALRKL